MILPFSKHNFFEHWLQISLTYRVGIHLLFVTAILRKKNKMSFLRRSTLCSDSTGVSEMEDFEERFKIVRFTGMLRNYFSKYSIHDVFLGVKSFSIKQYSTYALKSGMNLRMLRFSWLA